MQSTSSSTTTCSSKSFFLTHCLTLENIPACLSSYLLTLLPLVFALLSLEEKYCQTHFLAKVAGLDEQEVGADEPSVATTPVGPQSLCPFRFH